MMRNGTSTTPLGRGPVKALVPRCKNINEFISTNVGGTLPLRLFEVTSKEIMLLNLLRDGGKVDVKVFRESNKSSSSVSSPIESGTLPDMFADDRSNILRRVKSPMESGIVPPIEPPSTTAVNFSDFTSPDAHVTPNQSHTSLSGKPAEQDQPDTPREPILVELIMSHMLTSWPVATRGALVGT
jgi:hypothetical protein